MSNRPNAYRVAVAVLTCIGLTSARALAQIEMTVPAMAVDSYRPPPAGPNFVAVQVDVINHGPTRNAVITLNVYDSGYPSDARLIYDSHDPSPGESPDGLVELPGGMSTSLVFQFRLDLLPRPGVYRVLGAVREPPFGQILDTTGPGASIEDWSEAAHLPRFTVEPDLSNGTKGTTILLHGYNLGGQEDDITRSYWDDCRVEVCSLLRAHGGGIVKVYDPTTGNFADLDPNYPQTGFPDFCDATVDPAGERVLVLDWALQSNDPHSGEAEAAAESFLAAMVRGGQINLAQPSQNRHFHIIGHSRGAVVASELVQRLGYYGITVDYVTYLDPHDWSEGNVPEDGLFADPAVQVWDNVRYADNHFQETNLPPIPSGRRLDQLQDVAPFQIDLTDRLTLTQGCFLDNRHGLVSHWYFGTVEPRPYIDVDPNDWYPGDVFNDLRGGYSSGFSRWVFEGGYDRIGTSEGIIQDGPNAAACPSLCSEHPPIADPDGHHPDDNLADPKFFNGTFDLDYLAWDQADQIAGWHYHGGGGTAWLAEDEASNRYLELQHILLVDRRTRTHNWFYLSHHASRITFRYRIFEVQTPGTYTLRLRLRHSETDYADIWSLPINSAFGWTPVTGGVAIPSQWAGTACKLEFLLDAGSVGPTVRVGIDDIAIQEAAPCDGDVDSTGEVDLTDLATLLAHFGTPSGASRSDGDLDGDGDVDLTDISFLLGHYGEECPVAPPIGMLNVPAGTFQMGDPFNEGGANERPVHTVPLSSYAIDQYEVTNQQYAAALNWAYAQSTLITVTGGVVYKFNSGTSFPYCDTTSSSSASRVTWNGTTFGVVAGWENYPIVRVSWYGAAAYCNWRSTMEGRPLCFDTTTWACDFARYGYRLPTEAEWEKAAGWNPAGAGRHFRFGEGSDGGGYNSLDGHRANYWGSGDPFDNGSSPIGYYNGITHDGYPTQNAHSHYGCYDMSGNVWEWCYDWYSSSYYGTPEASYVDPHGPTNGTHRTVRGGAWTNDPSNSRASMRGNNTPQYRDPNLGFRCASGTP